MSAMRVRTKRWTRLEYERLIDRGIFREDERLELLDGVLVLKEPQGDPHAVAVDLVVAALRQAFGTGWLVRAHAPVALGRRSRPEPDVSVVRGSPRDYRSAAPTHPALVVEVSQTSLAHDRTRKASIYARANIQDYWIVNLVELVVEVLRDPTPLDPPSRGWVYRSVQTLQAGGSVAPLAAPVAPIAVADLLP
jgi:Uma2 family endonuclease